LENEFRSTEELVIALINDINHLAMTKVLIATFSQTGSTKKIAEQITIGLRTANLDVTHFEITRDAIPDLKEYDIIGIGTPTYFFRPPFIIKDFIKNLKGLENKASFVFILQGTNQGQCGNWIRKKLIKKGSIDLGYFRCYGADYWIGYIKRGTMFSPDSPTDQELTLAESFGSIVATRFADHSRKVEIFDPSTHFMYVIEQFFVARLFVKIIYTKAFYIDKTCDKCGICIEKCPENNIYENKKGKLRWGSECLLCATCELSCPKDSIHSALDWIIFSPFMHYNIARSKNKKVPYADVKHKNGETIVI
jgi:flavodoxin/NAD-dependent dihydropyrimidine dehydrogenase PreA subunit